MGGWRWRGNDDDGAVYDSDCDFADGTGLAIGADGDLGGDRGCGDDTGNAVDIGPDGDNVHDDDPDSLLWRC